MHDNQVVIPTSELERSRVLVRDAADVKRLRQHLLTHWTRPIVEFRVAGLPVVESQRAQDRFVRIYDGCNCLVGEVLGAGTFLGGSVLAWASVYPWRHMGLVILVSLYAAFIGKGIERAWMQVRLLHALRRLERRLAGKDMDETVPIRVAAKPFRVETDAPTQDVPLRPSARAPGSKRPKVLIRDSADINRAIPRLLTRWKLPRIEILAKGIPLLDVQRAQARVVRFSSGCSYLPAAALAVVTLLGGLLYTVRTESVAWLLSEREDWWLLKLDWSDVQPVVIAAMCAGVIGAGIEMTWLRLRLISVLRDLRDQLASS